MKNQTGGSSPSRLNRLPPSPLPPDMFPFTEAGAGHDYHKSTQTVIQLSQIQQDMAAQFAEFRKEMIAQRQEVKALLEENKAINAPDMVSAETRVFDGSESWLRSRWVQGLEEPVSRTLERADHPRFANTCLIVTLRMLQGEARNFVHNITTWPEIKSVHETQYSDPNGQRNLRGVIQAGTRYSNCALAVAIRRARENLLLLNELDKRGNMYEAVIHRLVRLFIDENRCRLGTTTFRHQTPKEMLDFLDERVEFYLGLDDVPDWDLHGSQLL